MLDQSQLMLLLPSIPPFHQLHSSALQSLDGFMIKFYCTESQRGGGSLLRYCLPPSFFPSFLPAWWLHRCQPEVFHHCFLLCMEEEDKGEKMRRCRSDNEVLAEGRRGGRKTGGAAAQDKL